MNWQPPRTVPKDGRFVQLLLDSGYTTTPYAIVIAQYVKEYEKGCPWRDHANDGITDAFTGDIKAWKPWEVPTLKFKKEYYHLKDGDEIKHGDEFMRGNEWVEIDQADINSFKKVTGKPLVYNEGDKPTRRKL